MKFVDEYRDAARVAALARLLARETTRPWTLMEVCGGQTHSILRYSLDTLLPPLVRIVHGPGCPVCVTPSAWIDKAAEIARLESTVLCSFGDMLRVPGERDDLFSAKASGADLRIVYSPLDAVEIARRSPDKQVVFFAVGFETTAPATATAVLRADELGLPNFSLLVCHVLVPPALRALLDAPDNEVQGFLAAGHVCAVMGYREYESIAQKYGVPLVVTGFEPVDLLEGALLLVRQLESGRHVVENQYRRAVDREGNPVARDLLQRVFQIVSRPWRGLGEIPQSGLGLRPEFSRFDAEARFGRVVPAARETGECQAGLVLRGVKRPFECPSFAKRCRPEAPLGAPMVSSEGACAAYYRYRGVAP